MRDIEAAVAYYSREGSRTAALGFIDALESAVRRIARHPASGSPRYADLLALPGLRAGTLSGYPHLVFYVEARDHVDVWRVLHGERDLASAVLEA